MQYTISNHIQKVGVPVFSITNECPSPEAAVRAWDLFFYDEINDFRIQSSQGELGIDYVMAKEGELNVIGEQSIYTRITA